MRTIIKLIIISILLSSCSIDYNDTANLKDKEMAQQISLLQDALYSKSLKFEEVVTHHHKEVFTCGKADGKYFMVRGGKAYVGHERMTGVEISTCCITLSGYYQFGDKPEISTDFTKESVDKFCAILSNLPNFNQAGEPATIADRYPPPWIEDANREIVKALVQKNITGCGELKYRQSYDRSREYLVYCTRDGTNWTSYIVFPRELMDSDVMGPYPPDPSLGP